MTTLDTVEFRIPRMCDFITDKRCWFPGLEGCITEICGTLIYTDKVDAEKSINH